MCRNCDAALVGFAARVGQQIKIEKNVPIPPEVPRNLSDALKRLEVGDSFTYHGVADAIYRLAKRKGIQVQVQRVDGGRLLVRQKADLRIWRVS
jgi:hypothetical protein